MARRLIDASALIEAERGRLDLATRLRPEDSTHLSPIVLSELLTGAHNANDEARERRRLDFVAEVERQFPLLPIDRVVAQRHARLRSELRTRGVSVGIHDLWLAATCLEYGLSIATFNVREFRRVPGLVVEDWSAA